MTYEDLYTSGDYAARNPGWHADEAPWKARAIKRIIEKNRLSPKTVVEVGCGVGEVLARLQPLLPTGVELRGYDISPVAIEQAQSRQNENLRFELGQGPAVSRQSSVVSHQIGEERVDLLLVIDVLEHIEDYLSWLRELHPRAMYTIVHIPLDLTVHRVLRGRALSAIRRRYGHLHYFNLDLGLDMLSEAGYEVMDWAYTEEFRETTPTSGKGRVLGLVRQGAYSVSPDWTVRLIGGCRLMVLAR
jgi:SAM-dependent methyltransferase